MGRRFPDCRRSRFFHRVVVAVGEYVATWYAAFVGKGVTVHTMKSEEYYLLFLSYFTSAEIAITISVAISQEAPSSIAESLLAYW